MYQSTFWLSFVRTKLYMSEVWQVLFRTQFIELILGWVSRLWPVEYYYAFIFLSISIQTNFYILLLLRSEYVIYCVSVVFNKSRETCKQRTLFLNRLNKFTWMYRLVAGCVAYTLIVEKITWILNTPHSSSATNGIFSPS